MITIYRKHQLNYLHFSSMAIIDLQVLLFNILLFLEKWGKCKYLHSQIDPLGEGLLRTRISILMLLCTIFRCDTTGTTGNFWSWSSLMSAECGRWLWRRGRTCSSMTTRFGQSSYFPRKSMSVCESHPLDATYLLALRTLEDMLSNVH